MTAHEKTTHFCLWPGCHKQVPARLWGCGRHWHSLPGGIRAQILAAYRPGQDATSASAAWYRATTAARDWIYTNHAPTDARVADALRTEVDRQIANTVKQMRLF